MAELYRPTKAWWRDVAELDQTLFERGKRERSGFVGRLGDRRRTAWTVGEQRFQLDSARSRKLLLYGVQHLSSALLQTEYLPSDEGSIGLVRRVEYTPTGVFAFGTHGVRDRRHAINVEQGMREEQSRVRRDRREQRRLGFSLPTEETFSFILDTLRQGEEMTR